MIDMVCNEDVYQIDGHNDVPISKCALNKCKCDIELAQRLTNSMHLFNADNVIESDSQYQQQCVVGSRLGDASCSNRN